MAPPCTGDRPLLLPTLTCRDPLRGRVASLVRLRFDEEPVAAWWDASGVGDDDDDGRLKALVTGTSEHEDTQYVCRASAPTYSRLLTEPLFLLWLLGKISSIHAIKSSRDTSNFVARRSINAFSTCQQARASACGRPHRHTQRHSHTQRTSFDSAESVSDGCRTVANTLESRLFARTTRCIAPRWALIRAWSTPFSVLRASKPSTLSSTAVKWSSHQD